MPKSNSDIKDDEKEEVGEEMEAPSEEIEEKDIEMKEENVMIKDDADDKLKEEKDDSDVTDDEDNDDGPKVEFPGTGRTVTLQMLLAAKILEPGKSKMTIEYLGQKFVGDLLPDGKIKSVETETIFCSPSAWAMHCKRIINPEKKSGCGWASVRYNGKKLDAYKTTYVRKCQLQKESTPSEDGDLDLDSKMIMSPPSPIKRNIMPFNTVSNRAISHDANTLVETVTFASLNKLQPFLVSISTSSVLLMDFHCHLTKNEVCGYLGGNWDINSHTLAITHAFPCRNSRHDREKAVEVEGNIQRHMLKNNLILVGWYHSHPKMPAQPTLRDCDAQLEYQIKMRGMSEATYTPCIGLICAPYFSENPSLESSITAYWVTPPTENRPMEYGRPMLMQFSVTQDISLTEEIKNEMVLAIEYYKQFNNELVKFEAKFGDDSTYIEKLKTTLYSKFPREQDDHVFWNWLRGHLGLSPEDKFTPPICLAEIKEPEPECMPSGTNPADGTTPILTKTECIDDEGMDTSRDDQQKDDGKDEKISVRTLQEQLSLPSGLNMTPSPISSSLSLQQQAQANCMSSSVSTHTASSSPRDDSPITIPSNSASPAKFEIPIRASPSPAKSDCSSIRNRNSPAPSPHKQHSSTPSEKSKGNPSPMPQQSSTPIPLNISSKYSESGGSASSTPHQAANNAMQDLLSTIGVDKIGNYNDYAMLLQQTALKDFGLPGLPGLPPGTNLTPSSSSSSNENKKQNTAASVAAAQQTNMKDFLAQLEKSADLNYLLQAQYPGLVGYPGLAGMGHVKPSDFATAAAAAAAAASIPNNTKSSKHEKSSKRNSSTPSRQQQISSAVAAAAHQQRLYEEEYKKDANKINDFLRSPEYVMMLLQEQNNSMGGALATQAYLNNSSQPSAVPVPPPQTTTSSRKSRKSATATTAISQQQQQQQQQSQAQQASMAELSQLLHGASPSKMHELNALFQQQMGLPNLTKQQQQQIDLLLQQQQSVLAAPSASTSSSSSQNQSSKNAMADYMSLLSQQSKVSDTFANLGSTPQLPPGFQPDLSMLFGNKQPDVATLNASIDMLGNLLQTLGHSKNTGADITSILFPPGGNKNHPNLPDISQFIAAASQFPLPGVPQPTQSKSQQTSTTTSTSNNAFYSQSGLDKMQQDLLAMYGVGSQAGSSGGGSGGGGGGNSSSSTSGNSKYGSSSIPDPLSKSTLAANNMFMPPSSIYAKLQQDALNAMIMKPPSNKISAASPYSSTTKSRETSASPARNYNRDSPSINSSPANVPSKSPSSKHNFSVVDLAVSSVPISPRSPSIKSTSSNNSTTPNDKQLNDERKTPSMLDVENLTAQNFTKKRMEFSSIADLVSTPPKLRKIDEFIGSVYGVQDLHARDPSPINLGKHSADDDRDGVLNLSSDA